jgi:hypothetical protein
VQRTPTLSRRLVAGVQDTLGYANAVGFEASYERHRPLHFAGSTTSAMRASGWISRRLERRVTGRLGASYLRQPFGHVTDVPVYRRIRLDAEISVLVP